MALMAAVMDSLSYVMSFSLRNFIEPDAAGRAVLFSYDVEFNVDLFQMTITFICTLNNF